MSTALLGIGKRMLSVRTELGYPQSKMAGILGIADKSYKNYELEKRELPLSVATSFCAEFEVELLWLVFGSVSVSVQRSAELAGETARAVFEQGNFDLGKVSPLEVEKYGRYIFEQSSSKGTSPSDEAKLFFSAISRS